MKFEVDKDLQRRIIDKYLKDDNPILKKGTGSCITSKSPAVIELRFPWPLLHTVEFIDNLSRPIRCIAERPELRWRTSVTSELEIQVNADHAPRDSAKVSAVYSLWIPKDVQFIHSFEDNEDFVEAEMFYNGDRGLERLTVNTPVPVDIFTFRNILAEGRDLVEADERLGLDWKNVLGKYQLEIYRKDKVLSAWQLELFDPRAEQVIDNFLSIVTKRFGQYSSLEKSEVPRKDREYFRERAKKIVEGSLKTDLERFSDKFELQPIDYGSSKVYNFKPGTKGNCIVEDDKFFM